MLTGPDATVDIPVEAIAAAVTITPDAADGFVVAVDGAALRTPFTDAVEATQTAPADAHDLDRRRQAGDRAERARAAPSTGRPPTPASRARCSAPHTMPIVYVTSEPALTTEKAQALGINEVIGEFTTGGFAAASGVNIRVVAEKVNGAIVQPGATFGLNEFTGTRGTEQGYVPAAIIQEGALSTAVGGGISQFATTLYNAAYFAGMGDVTHTPHSFYISRYPPGREATVFDGEIELAFSNDYPTGVLIQTDLDRRRHHRPAVGDQARRGRVDDHRPVRLHLAAGDRQAVRHVVQPVRRQHRVLRGQHQDHQGPRRQGTAPGGLHHGLQRPAERRLRAGADAAPRQTAPAAATTDRGGSGRRRADQSGRAGPGYAGAAPVPAGPADPRPAAVAQLVAHPTCNRAVRGSSPLGGSPALALPHWALLH